MADRMWIHTDGWAGRIAWPCDVLSRGKKYAKVVLIAGLKVGGKSYPRGHVKSRIPLEALLEQPNFATVVKPLEEQDR